MADSLVFGPQFQVADDGKWTERVDDLDEAVDGDNDNRVLDSVCESLLIGGVCCVVYETDSSREEDLTDSILPDLAAGELVAVPRCEVELDAFGGIRKRA